jgi:hypothetical protein
MPNSTTPWLQLAQVDDLKMMILHCINLLTTNFN